MNKIIIILVTFCTHSIWAQGKEWHVRPNTTYGNYTNAPGSDGTTFEKAWCLQYALSGGANGTQIQPGDTVWLHGDIKATYNGTPSVNAIYKGHFKSTLTGSTTNYIKVASYPGEWAVIDGNVFNPTVPINGNSEIHILEVKKGNVTFENFEITCLGNFSRIKEARVIVEDSEVICATSNPPAYGFHEYRGIEHTANVSAPIRNEFRNLVLRNIPGVAIGSWKYTLDSEIYGNIFYNNGIIEVFGTGCEPPLEQVPLTSANCRGHQTNIYTQNASNVNRIIRNNIFLNCYDSAVNIWSSNDNPTSLDYVQNYIVSKNIFINNGNPVADSTANMLISTDNNDIFNINIESNLMYKNSPSSGNSGILVSNSNNVNINHNYFFNGTTAAIFSGAGNHSINFQNNFYAGKRIQVLTDVSNFQSPSNPWVMDNNNYYNKNLGTDLPNMYLAPNNYTSISIEAFRLNYGAEINSNRYDFASNTPASRYFIVQNRYNPNVFNVTIYNPIPSSNFSVDFSNYDIPNNRAFVARDVQNYFTKLSIGTNIYNAASHTINFPLGLTALEPALPQPNNTSFGTSFITPIQHSNSDLISFTVEFDCGLTHDKYIDRIDNGLLNDEVAKNNISFGTGLGYTANASVVLTSKASKQIVIKNTTIFSGAKFLAKIEDTCPDIPFNLTADSAQFDMGTGLNRMASESPSFVAKDNQKEYFTISPNPNSGIFEIKSLTEIKIQQIEISKVNTAEIVFEKQVSSNAATIVDIANESSGVYIVKAYFENGSIQTKTITKK